MRADAIGIHADLSADVDARTVALAQQIEQLHLALIVRAAQAPHQKHELWHSPVRERCRLHAADLTALG